MRFARLTNGIIIMDGPEDEVIPVPARPLGKHEPQIPMDRSRQL